MFNQKVNGYLSQNPDYLNSSLGAPHIRPVDIHNCGTTILKYNKKEKCGSLPLQSWCSPNVATESFAMRPITNSKEYFENIRKYLSSLVFSDIQPLNQSGMKNQKYKYVDNYATEPSNSFLQAIEINVTNHLNEIMGSSTNKIDMFNKYNPICESLIINDIDIKTYQSTSVENNFLHHVNFAAVNTTRYNTISFRAEIYQDTTPMIEQWNKLIKRVQMSQDISLQDGKNSNTNIYIGVLDLLNNTSCVLGQESECEFRGHNISNAPMTSNLINQNDFPQAEAVSWLQYPSLGDKPYNQDGNYDQYGNLRIRDQGPENFESLLNSFL